MQLISYQLCYEYEAAEQTVSLGEKDQLLTHRLCWESAGKDINRPSGAQEDSKEHETQLYVTHMSGLIKM